MGCWTTDRTNLFFELLSPAKKITLRQFEWCDSAWDLYLIIFMMACFCLRETAGKTKEGVDVMFFGIFW